MNTFAKVLVVIVLLLSSGFAISQMVLYSKREMYRAKYAEERQQRTKLEDQLETKTEQVDEIRIARDQIQQRLTSQVNNLKEDLQDAELQISDLKRRNENLQTTASETSTRLNNLVDRLNEKDGVIDQLEQKVEDLDGDLKDALAKVENLDETVRTKENKIDQLDKRIAELQQEKRQIVQEREDLESVLAQLEAKGVHVGTTEVPIIEAKVVRVDNELGAVVLDKGKEDNVQVGYPFTIYRDSEYVARVYVQQVHEDYSLARVDKQLAQQDTKVGDEATTRIQ
jgi:myosin heavy subunit